MESVWAKVAMGRVVSQSSMIITTVLMGFLAEGKGALSMEDRLVVSSLRFGTLLTVVQRDDLIK
jgi:hypothetical protein